MKNGYIILLAIAIVGFFTLAGIETYNKNRPPAIPEDQVAKYVAEIFKKDSVINLPIRYKFKDQEFKSNGDTTYWFFIAEHSKGRSSVCIAIPYSHFDFYYSAKYLQGKNNNKLKDIFITYFTQVSQASYQSYDIYAEKY